MRFILLTFLLVFSRQLFAQELNFGISSGLIVIPEKQKISYDEENEATLSATFEYIPGDKIFELGTEVRFVVGEYDNVKFPLYLNFIIGEKFKVCPTIGAFISTNGNFGGLTGVVFEYVLRKKFTTFFRYEFFSERYEETVGSHFGNAGTYLETRYGHWFGIGLKYNLLKSK